MDQHLNTEQQAQTPRPSNTDDGVAHARVAPLAKQEVDAETNPPGCETCPDRMVLEEEDSEADHPAEPGDMQGKAGASTSAQDECQSNWSLEECQELLGEVMAEKTKFHGSKEKGDEPMEEMLLRTPPRKL